MSGYKQSSETALHLFTDKVPVIKEYHTVGDIEQLLLLNSKFFETINYIYVVDDNQHLKGILSIKEVFKSSKEKFAKNLMHNKPVFVHTETDQEEVVYLAIKIKLNPFLLLISSNDFSVLFHQISYWKYYTMNLQRIFFEWVESGQAARWTIFSDYLCFNLLNIDYPG